MNQSEINAFKPYIEPESVFTSEVESAVDAAMKQIRENQKRALNNLEFIVNDLKAIHSDYLAIKDPEKAAARLKDLSEYFAIKRDRMMRLFVDSFAILMPGDSVQMDISLDVHECQLFIGINSRDKFKFVQIPELMGVITWI